MCYYTQQTKLKLEIETRFDVSIETDEPVSSSRFNGFAHPKTPVIINATPRLIELYNWGLIPFWAKDATIRKNTLNAQIETLSEKPSFKSHIKNRCLIIVDGFFEWKWLDPAGKVKEQYAITLPDNGLFACAGIYNTWADKSTGLAINSYAMITTEANELMAEIHHYKKRMPVILTPQNERDWLNGEDYMVFAKPNVELKTTML